MESRVIRTQMSESEVYICYKKCMWNNYYKWTTTILYEFVQHISSLVVFDSEHWFGGDWGYSVRDEHGFIDMVGVWALKFFLHHRLPELCVRFRVGFPESVWKQFIGGGVGGSSKYKVLYGRCKCSWDFWVILQRFGNWVQRCWC